MDKSYDQLALGLRLKQEYNVASVAAHDQLLDLPPLIPVRADRF